MSIIEIPSILISGGISAFLFSLSFKIVIQSFIELKYTIKFDNRQKDEIFRIALDCYRKINR